MRGSDANSDLLNINDMESDCATQIAGGSYTKASSS